MGYKVSEGLCLDTAGTDGLTTEVSQTVALDGRNAIQAEIVLYAFTATTLSVTVEVSIDGVNFVQKGSAQTMNGIGRAVLNVEGSVAAATARLKFTLTGSGKAILDATMTTSTQ